MGYIEERCWKCEKDVKASFASNNYLKVLVDDDEPTLK
jgi:hypothetical protein